MDNRPTSNPDLAGPIIKSGVMHVYEHPDDMRHDMTVWGREMSHTAWIDGTVFHVRTKPEPQAEPEKIPGDLYAAIKTVLSEGLWVGGDGRTFIVYQRHITDLEDILRKYSVK